MRKLTLLFFLFSFRANCQVSIVSGRYREMNIAYDKKSKLVTGYYENYTGYDEETKQPRFSCIFYLKGTLSANKIEISTYYPLDPKDDLIPGELTVVNKSEIKIHLPQEHGGCWNVEHFADKPVDLKLEKEENWIQIRYADKDKVYFYSERSEANKQRAYLVKGDIVYIEKIEGQWAFCSYKAEHTTTGWIKLADLNRLN